MKAKRNLEPETRVGICCGDACKAAEAQRGVWNTAALYKVPGIFRYRCASCFRIETGHDHHLAPKAGVTQP